MLISEIEFIFDQFEPNDNLFVTFKRPNGEVWLVEEPVVRPYPASQLGLDVYYDLPTIIIPSKGWQQFYTVFPVQELIEYSTAGNLYIALRGPKGEATFTWKDNYGMSPFS